MLRCLSPYLVDHGRDVQIMSDSYEGVCSAECPIRYVITSCVDTGSDHAECTCKKDYD